ncbi:pilin [Candidatus Nanosynbacter sp. TM7-075]|uniref:pilin n=1 Tax=unclassified Candidatus Nanosynbacter TaxID=2725944 RepID=UPI001FB5B8F0|nr:MULTISPECIES: pilin [unclassified Candidatus Nanosynbacter]MCJ1967249.1 pilin [Candidatus Nanosynbacter sp. TM7-075]MCJ1967888.1 pilin [Candidatus Nanosynbacter sp. TM7-076]
MKIFTKILTAGMLMVSLLGVFTPVVSAANGINICSEENENSVYCKNKDSGGDQVGGIIKTIVEVLLMAVGAISIIMIVIGGILFALSSGDAQKAAKARSTILYAVVGLIVSVFASAIVNFVFDGFNKPVKHDESSNHNKE